jgi:hypothetical protein
MKTILALAVATTLTFGMISCGPSDAEKKADSAQLDSTKKEMDATGDHMIDSMNAANEAAAKAQQKADSIKLQDSLAKMKKK